MLRLIGYSSVAACERWIYLAVTAVAVRPAAVSLFYCARGYGSGGRYSLRERRFYRQSPDAAGGFRSAIPRGNTVSF